MWTGGVRVAIINDDMEVLMVRQQHPEREIWLLPGGGIEDGETSVQAAVREVKEETGLDVEVACMLWHVEQVKQCGEQRYVNYFLAKTLGGEPSLGADPELDESGQVLREVRFVGKDEMQALENVYPSFLKDELWYIISGKNETDVNEIYDPYKLRSDQK